MKNYLFVLALLIVAVATNAQSVIDIQKLRNNIYSELNMLKESYKDTYEFRQEYNELQAGFNAIYQQISFVLTVNPFSTPKGLLKKNAEELAEMLNQANAFLAKVKNANSDQALAFKANVFAWAIETIIDLIFDWRERVGEKFYEYASWKDYADI